ncbi:MAG: hypothetical protein AAF609_05355 [Cyanobacteria bacterium P01_C01_bin.120]
MQPATRPHMPAAAIKAAAEYRRKVVAGEIQPVTHQPAVKSVAKRKRSRSPLIEAMQLGA